MKKTIPKCNDGKAKKGTPKAKGGKAGKRRSQKAQQNSRVTVSEMAKRCQWWQMPVFSDSESEDDSKATEGVDASFQTQPPAPGDEEELKFKPK